MKPSRYDAMASLAIMALTSAGPVAAPGRGRQIIVRKVANPRTACDLARIQRAEQKRARKAAKSSEAPPLSPSAASTSTAGLDDLTPPTSGETK